jgi:hypothetical protein
MPRANPEMIVTSRLHPTACDGGATPSDRDAVKHDLLQGFYQLG